MVFSVHVLDYMCFINRQLFQKYATEQTYCLRIINQFDSNVAQLNLGYILIRLCYRSDVQNYLL